MSDSEDASTLNEDEQSKIAVEWHMAMWDELIKRGIEPSVIALGGLSLTASKAVNIFGRDQALAVVDKVRDKIVAGHFDEADASDQENPE